MIRRAMDKEVHGTQGHAKATVTFDKLISNILN